jgi:hypothetical protein
MLRSKARADERPGYFWDDGPVTGIPKLLFAFSSVVCIMFGCYLGLNLKDWIYFSDDEAVKEAIYYYAIDSMVAEAPTDDGPELRAVLLAMRPDFFRSKEYECVRFLPEYGEYSFIRVFCRNRADGSVKFSNY